jgi:hypothetical protein
MECFLYPLLAFGCLAGWRFPPVGVAALRLSRWLIPLGILHAVGFGLVVWALGVPAETAALFALLLFFASGYLLPDPLNFLIHPRKRRAAYRAVRFAEQLGVGVLYDTLKFVAVEPDRCVLWVCHDWRSKPPRRLFVTVYDSGEVRELTSEERDSYPIEPWI